MPLAHLKGGEQFLHPRFFLKQLLIIRKGLCSSGGVRLATATAALAEMFAIHCEIIYKQPMNWTRIWIGGAIAAVTLWVFDIGGIILSQRILVSEPNLMWGEIGSIAGSL